MSAPPVLARVRSRLRRTVALGGTARLAAVLLACAGGAILADRLWFLPGWLRLILLLAIVAGAGLLAWRRLVRPLRRPLSDRDLAVFIERRTPGLDGRLISAVEGIELGEADRARLEQALPGGAERALVPASRLPRLVAGAGLAIAAGIALACAVPAFWRDGLIRLALPLSEHDWERAAAFAIRPERAVVAVDEQAVILVERQRGSSGAARIQWSDGRGGGGARQLPGIGGPWRQALPLAAGRWTVSVHGGDAHPARCAVLVVERPHLDAARTVLTPPAYAGLPAQELPSPACQALPGSRLDLRLVVGAPDGRAVRAVSAALGDQAIALTRDGDAWVGSATVTASADLLVDAADADGIALLPRARFAVVADPDRAPAVSLSGPRADEAVGPHAKVAVALEAGDDHGLARLGLAATASGAASADPRTLLDEAGAGRTAVTRRVLVDVAALAGPGASIVLVGTAQDRNDVTGPGVGTSAPLVLKVVAEDELRRDLERQLSEARDRVHQARAALAPGLADPAKLPAAARAAAQDAARVAEALARVERRWAENGLEPERIAPAAEARAAAGAEAGDALAKAASGDRDGASAGDAALDRAERALDRMLSDSDLTRIIAQILERQKALAEETRAFVREHLVRRPDEAGRTRQADLAGRQRELSARSAEAERRILSGPDTIDAAKAVVREQAPSERMGAAAGDVASDDRRPRSIEAQQGAIAALARILEALRGGDQLADLARRAGELAERQERLAEAVERGMPREDAQREQERLRQETGRLAEELKDRPEAQDAASAAANAQQGAASALSKGDRAGAARDAGTAGELLRSAQRALDPRQSEERERQQEQQSQPDVVALLRALFGQQAQVLADSLPIDRRIGEDEPDFAARRDLSAVAQLQDDVLLRLREEGLKLLDRNPIALAAVRRVETAMDRTLAHLRAPALGARGLALERIALAELKRVIDIAASIQTQGGEGGGQDGQGGQASQAPFPPAAEIALLVARQGEIHALAAAGRPVDTGAMQAELAKLIALVEGATRPGSRPNVLMARARRSADGAAALLAARDGGAVARHHMLASEESLRQILAEAKGSGGGQSQNPDPQRQPPRPQDGGAPPPPAAGGATPGAADAQPSQAQAGGSDAQSGGVRAEQERTALLQLPPERREQLRQAREQRLPAGALQLFERYLEKLEER